MGGIGVLSYMLYNLKNKPKGQSSCTAAQQREMRAGGEKGCCTLHAPPPAGEKLSVYLIHTRLGVQSTVIGALCLVMGYSLFR